MLAPFDRKMVSVTPPAAKLDNASATTAEIDTLGYRFAVINVYLGDTDIAAAALKVQESDVSGSGFADITGTRFGTDNQDTGAASALPSANDDNKFFQIFIDLRGRKRYLDVVFTAGDGTTGTFAAIWCELYRGEKAPRLASESGVAQRLVA
jgi:hypothetical protein